MSQERHRKITLAARPIGEPKESDFALIESAVPEPGQGQMLLRTIWLSLDPYMRGRMNAQRSYATPVEIGGVMEAGTVSEVMKSNLPAFKPGDIVEGRTGWQSHALSDGKGLRKIDPNEAPISTALGVLGMPGMTAYTGLLTIGKPKPGETVAVSAASGAVGSLVGQIAKMKGARAVGIAGGPKKCQHVVAELGFDACIDYQAPGFAEALAKACPKGIDVYFENVGGTVFEAVLPLLNPFARIPVCGLIAHYNATSAPPGPNMVPALMAQILTKRLHIEGFIVTDFWNQFGDFMKEIAPAIRAKRLKYREDVVEGLENAPRAFQGLLKGANFGKLLVRVGAERQGKAK
ncbi:MAG TPA: NADP-dependent oxidoreductase [Stellaceae bacterium]|nr:NADP-dependent oxidoreductase [Stellaceae bacterium]